MSKNALINDNIPILGINHRVVHGGCVNPRENITLAVQMSGPSFPLDKLPNCHVDGLKTPSHYGIDALS